MTKELKPHYVYVSRNPDGFSLVIMSRKQELQVQPLTADLALKFAKDFLVAAAELHKSEVTQAGNKEKQEDMFAHDKGKNGADNHHPSV